MANPHGYSQIGIELLAQELYRRGINPAAATGAIAGIMGESGANLDPTSFNSKDPGGGSGGIGQWNRGRLVGPDGMLAFAKNAGIPVDINTPTDARKVPLAIQAQYLGHELDTTYAGVRDQLRSAQNPQDALNIWVKSYENPADKAGAIAQRTQYLGPVGTTLNTPGFVQNAASTAAAEAGKVGAGAPSTPAATGGGGGGGGVLPGFKTAQASNQFTQGLDTLDKAMGGPGVNAQNPLGPGGGGQQQQDMRPSPMIEGPGLANRSMLLGLAPQLAQRISGYAPQPYGNTINSMGPIPAQWGGAPPGQPTYAGLGPQASPYGTSLGSLSQLQQQIAMMGMVGMGGMGYGGYF